MDRRELLKRMTYLMGGALSAPAVTALLQGCAPKEEAQSVNYKPVFLSPEQLLVVAEVAEVILPRTQTPGAKDVGVPAFIDTILKDVYPKADQERYVTGLTEFSQRAQSAHGKSFASLEPKQREALVREVHEQALQVQREKNEEHAERSRPFILMTKELTLLGFFTSEAGATQVLQYTAVPGSYKGCVPLKDAGTGKSWAIEQATIF